MSAHVFDRFVGIDWSGAHPARGIAVAFCDRGRGGPRTMAPRCGSRWTRTAVLEWLLGELASSRRLLIGFDFAFSLGAGRGTFLAGADATAFDLWALVDRVAGDGPDYLGLRFATGPEYGGAFWRRGRQPVGFDPRRRRTEIACHRAGFGQPETPFKLIGAKQVGKAGLAGMRVLHALRRQAGSALAIWPFEPIANDSSVCVEIYPRLFLRRAGWNNRKLRRWDDLDRCLARFGSRSAFRRGELSDHDGDAMIAAAGLRALAGQPDVWHAPEGSSEAMQREGWIFGVPAVAL